MLDKRQHVCTFSCCCWPTGFFGGPIKAKGMLLKVLESTMWEFSQTWTNKYQCDLNTEVILLRLSLSAFMMKEPKRTEVQLLRCWSSQSCSVEKKEKSTCQWWLPRFYIQLLQFSQVFNTTRNSLRGTDVLERSNKYFQIWERSSEIVDERCSRTSPLILLTQRMCTRPTCMARYRPKLSRGEECEINVRSTLLTVTLIWNMAAYCDGGGFFLQSMHSVAVHFT